MRRTRRAPMLAFAAAITAVAATGATALALPFGFLRPPVACPDVWAPVLCPNGKVYSNSCWASVAGQKNCIPWGDAVR